ncbi:hypothetical protein B0H16DRAFT_1734819 [Mycena metata]|uniref:Carbamoyl phosphate synthase ATP-binding domain-containing protein n=1 Tax=Mycena metata TaxID=1033252 RepID=A0AAD7HTT9_9AGAR|nr:hypothetical protein B0H16DRAFT_1734819 [Mycena metata]
MTLTVEEVIALFFTSTNVTPLQAVPTVLVLNSSRATQGIPSLLIISAGSQLFDIFKGLFTRNGELAVSPLVAVKVLWALNEKGAECLWPGVILEVNPRAHSLWGRRVLDVADAERRKNGRE